MSEHITISFDWAQLGRFMDELKTLIHPDSSSAVTGGTTWRPDMAPKPQPPPNADRLQDLDRTNMEDAFIHLFAIHERHKKGDTYLCQTCPLCDHAICAYSTLVAMCEVTGVNIQEIKNLWLTPGQEANHV